MTKNFQVKIIIILHTVLFFLWIFIFKNENFGLLVGSDLFILIAALISFRWLFHTYRLARGTFKYFWFILSMGVGCSIVAQAICIYYRLFLQSSLPYPSLADVFWLLQCILFLTALVIKRGLSENFYPMTRFLFNILIIMTVATSMSWKYLIDPNLSFASDNIMATVISMAYPIFNLVILFATVSLYLIAQHSIDKTVLSFISVGFVIKILADAVYVFEFMKEIIVIGENWFAPLWSFSLLLIGLAGLSSFKQESTTSIKTNNKYKHDQGNAFTYISVILFFVLVIFQKPNMSVLDIGFLVTFLLIFLRQIVTLKENQKLSFNLEKQVEERTIELNTALEKMERMANYDHLTGLPNRNKLFQHLEEYIERCEHDNTKLALMFIDLDRFKMVNDTMGHEAGDLLLKEVSNRLKSSVPTGDIVARHGGDEFIIILTDGNKDKATHVAKHIIDNFTPPFYLRGEMLSTTPSIGISIYPDNGKNKEELIKNADLAMYQSKEKGKNTFQLYS